MQKEMENFYLGTSNITLPVANKRSFPDAFKNGSRLAYYASLFNSLEINSSFYKIPQAKTVTRWMAEVPDNFRVTFKMFKEITHNKMLSYDPQLIERFMRTINVSGNKKGGLLIQFPAGIPYNLEYLRRLLYLVQQHNEGWNVCVEFRHYSWYRDAVYHLLETYESSMVVHDMPKSKTPEAALWTDFVYLRFHGPVGDYKGSYNLDWITVYADKIKLWLADARTVYVYFNNTIGNAVFDALTLQELITGKIAH